MNETIQNGIAVTGALGNLGWKLLCHLAEHSAAPRLVGLDLRPAEPGRLEKLQTLSEIHADPARIELLACDLGDFHDARWRNVIHEVSAVVHFAARNPFPEATWDDATRSMDMTNHISQASADSSTLKRFVFASSNHVMGRYKDANIGAGQLHTELEAGVGTRWFTGQKEMDSTIYATAKFAGERQCRTLGQKGDTSFVCVRIGWCQPGENLPGTLSAAGTPTQQSDPDPGLDQTNRWFKEMWLSNRDFLHLFDRALLTDALEWPENCIVVNGMSHNTQMAWDLTRTRRFLDYAPKDDVYA
jgi:nucleoside-diphosphate-sugar epimerase